MSGFARLALAVATLAAPGVAWAANVGPVEVFANAAPLQKALALALSAAIIACLVVGVRKLAAGPHAGGGSAFVSGLRLGGPLAGLLGGAYAAIRMSAGLAQMPGNPGLNALAPAFAEAASLVALGFAAGAIAVVLNWAIEARLDRAVLSHD